MLLQDKIVKKLGVKKNIKAKEEIKKIVEFIVHYVKNNESIKTLVIGVSGGQDSTLTGKLCQLAVTKLNEQSRSCRLIAIRLPYGKQFDESDCQEAIKFIKPHLTLTVDIKKAVLASANSLHSCQIYLDDKMLGNIKARERMKIQYGVANSLKGIVIGTSQAAEILTGFCTKGGDGVSDMNPIAFLNKRQGRQLLQELNCPKFLYTKIPTADLEDNRPGLPDEEVIGVSYKIIDDYLEGNYVSNADRLKIETMFLSSQHKRTQSLTVK